MATAKCLIVAVQPGVQHVWCDRCLLETAVRLYGFTSRTFGVVGLWCSLCGKRDDDRTD